MTADIGIDIYAPAGVPSDVVERLNAALAQVVDTPETRDRFIKYGLIIAPSSPQQLAAFQAEELKKWAAPIKASGYTGRITLVSWRVPAHGGTVATTSSVVRCACTDWSPRVRRACRDERTQFASLSACRREARSISWPGNLPRR